MSREYRKKHYERNKDRVKAVCNAWRIKNRARVLAKKHQVYEETQAWIREHRSKAQCVDCGWNEDADLLQFDHLPGTDKKRNVSASGGVLTAMKEAAKCELVCPNCHAKRTKARGQLRQQKKVEVVEPKEEQEKQLRLWSA